MVAQKSYNVYIIASVSGVLYIGITSNLIRRVWEHKNGDNIGFTQKYHCTKLVYYEVYDDITRAISREKQLKGWSRIKKEFLIGKDNRSWRDLSLEWE